MYRNQIEGVAQESQTDFGYAETDPTGRYGRFEEVLGRGAMKTVYKAIDQVLGMEVAWNQVRLTEVLRSPHDLQRLYSEVHLLSALKHDSIIRFHTSWIDVDNKNFNFITEMFTSGSLREYRKKYVRVDIRAIKSWARQILEGLVFLHEHDPPVIHRDLKCDNIFVNGHLGQVKIGDLGLARILRGSEYAHSVIGTPEFMAPELYDENYNELIDVYSFGMCVLEMITSEFPYSECANPAQIYKKVTSGKLPCAFYRVPDLETQRFIGKCLVPASRRVSAKELLSDPYLASDEAWLLPMTKLQNEKPFLNEQDMERLQLEDETPKTNMTITGKLNSDDGTIFLKVQIADKDGQVRNVYFPFDIVNDTAVNVAAEMVKELEITDWEPIEIAKMIDGEISALVPDWKRWDVLRPKGHYYAFSHQDVENDGCHHQNLLRSGSDCSSSQYSLPELAPHGGYNCVQDDLHDDTCSQSSSHSGTYSNTVYLSGNEHVPETSPGRCGKVLRTNHAPSCGDARFLGFGSVHRQYGFLRDSHRAARSDYGTIGPDDRRLLRNQSSVDVRSQLLHQSIVEEVTKRRQFKTVGGVESIGFQSPYKATQKASKRPSWQRSKR